MIRLSPAKAGIILAVLVLLVIPLPSAGTIRMQPEYRVGDVITLTGTTNLASGDRVWIEVISASFAPAQKGEDTTFSGSSGIVTVDHGTWSYTFDTAGFRQDQYLVTVEAVGIGVIDKGSFVLRDRPVATQPTTSAATPSLPAGTATVPMTASLTATTPEAGGFAGLLAVPALIFIFLRRRA